LTQTGGSIPALGTFFKILPDGSEFSVIYIFDSLNGGAPIGSLLNDGNFLYGMTSQGGIKDLGVIFKYQIPIGRHRFDSLSGNGFIVSPNPNNGQFTINTSGQHLISKTEIYNSFGSKIYSSPNTNVQPSCLIDISTFPKGIYYIKIFDEGNNVSEKKVAIE
jgi:hypothetical protein